MTEFERILLKLIKVGTGRFGWYALEIRLSQMDVPRDHDAMSVLKGLEARRLVRRCSAELPGQDRWEITEQGLKALAAEPT